MRGRLDDVRLVLEPRRAVIENLKVWAVRLCLSNSSRKEKANELTSVTTIACCVWVSSIGRFPGLAFGSWNVNPDGLLSDI